MIVLLECFVHASVTVPTVLQKANRAVMILFIFHIPAFPFLFPSS